MKTQPTLKTAALAGIGVLLGASMLVLPGCTDLNEEPFSAITSENFYESEADYLTGLAGVYAQLRAMMWNYYNLSEVSSDETVVPTRGTDWFDGGRWISMHRHTWDPSLTDLNGAWADAFVGAARANELLLALDRAETLRNRAQLQAEARFLRAFFYYQLMDLFGGVPIVTEADYPVDQNSPPPTNTREEVFNFVTQELQDVREQLPVTYPASGYGRATQGAADALLANALVNAPVFTGTVTASGLQRGRAMWNEALQAADRVINSGAYRLADDWFSNFSPINNNVPELIFVVPNLAAPDLGMTMPMRTLHYNQLTPSPWNGFSTLAEAYNAFDKDDTRHDMWLVGPQINFETGQTAHVRCPAPNPTDCPVLAYTPEIADITSATESEGVRFAKFIPDLDNVGGNHGNDYPFFRLAEMYLIRAEALNELGRTGEALEVVNFLRARVFDPDEPVTAAGQEQMREVILRERLFELAGEAKRRQDLIRFGRFTQTWEHKDNTQPYRVLFPVPQLQLDANPNLQQNPGYGG